MVEHQMGSYFCGPLNSQTSGWNGIGKKKSTVPFGRNPSNTEWHIQSRGRWVVVGLRTGVGIPPRRSLSRVSNKTRLKLSLRFNSLSVVRLLRYTADNKRQRQWATKKKARVWPAEHERCGSGTSVKIDKNVRVMLISIAGTKPVGEL